ncbi:Enhancer of split m5 protein [Dissostichus eleginoides]|uniref:Enhancer of split m5 protein n=1 Tax=Dissostichus eleginoides TaxID=100907 RepID=A0AAD9C283_DISEL|nr:Enhancer of split m5 protein [Dissostichus eleginoides]
MAHRAIREQLFSFFLLSGHDYEKRILCDKGFYRSLSKSDIKMMGWINLWINAVSEISRVQFCKPSSTLSPHPTCRI